MTSPRSIPAADLPAIEGDDLDLLLGIADNPSNRLARALLAEETALLTGLRTARENAGLSVADVAERMGVSSRDLLDLEAGIADPPLSMIRRYAIAVGAAIDHDVIAISDSH